MFRNRPILQKNTQIKKAPPDFFVVTMKYTEKAQKSTFLRFSAILIYIDSQRFHASA